MTNKTVFIAVCWLSSLYLAFDYGFSTGAAEPRKCAAVQGQQVVSTTAEVCTYAATYGRATTKRRAG